MAARRRKRSASASSSWARSRSTSSSAKPRTAAIRSSSRNPQVRTRNHTARSPSASWRSSRPPAPGAHRRRSWYSSGSREAPAVSWRQSMDRGVLPMAAENELLKRITVNPEIFGGKPIIRGRRLAVEHVLGMLAAGTSPELLLQGYPWLEKEDIQACLVYARRLVGHERIEPLKIESAA